MTKAIEYFRQTIEADPCYALAYVGLADCHNLLGSYGVTPSSKAVPRAKAAAKKALDIDPDLAEAHASLGLAALNYDWNWSVAETEFKRAIELNPNYGTAHHWYSSFLRAMGQFDKAIAEAVEAVELDPLSLIANTNLALNFYYARRYEQSIEQFKQAREIDENFYVAYMIGLPYEQKGMYKEAIAEFQKATSLSGDNPGVLACLGHAYAMEGRRAEAAEILATLDRLSNQRYISPYDKAVVLAALSEKDEAIEWLKKAHEHKDQNLTVVNVDPRLDPLRSDSRFANLLVKMGLERN